MLIIFLPVWRRLDHYGMFLLWLTLLPYAWHVYYVCTRPYACKRF